MRSMITGASARPSTVRLSPRPDRQPAAVDPGLRRAPPVPGPDVPGDGRGRRVREEVEDREGGGEHRPGDGQAGERAGCPGARRWRCRRGGRGARRRARRGPAPPAARSPGRADSLAPPASARRYVPRPGGMSVTPRCDAGDRERPPHRAPGHALRRRRPSPRRRHARGRSRGPGLPLPAPGAGRHPDHPPLPRRRGRLGAPPRPPVRRCRHRHGRGRRSSPTGSPRPTPRGCATSSVPR